MTNEVRLGCEDIFDIAWRGRLDQRRCRATTLENGHLVACHLNVSGAPAA